MMGFFEWCTSEGRKFLGWVSSKIAISWVSASSLEAGLLWLLYGCLGGLVPLWGTSLLLMLFGRDINLFELLKNGEFVLYAASFIGGGLYTLRADVFPRRNWLNAGLVFLLVVSLLVFTAITLPATFHLTNFPALDAVALTKVSMGILMMATSLCFIIAIAEAGGAAQNLPEEYRKDMNALNQELDKLLGQGDQK